MKTQTFKLSGQRTDKEKKGADGKPLVLASFEDVPLGFEIGDTIAELVAMPGIGSEKEIVSLVQRDFTSNVGNTARSKILDGIEDGTLKPSAPDFAKKCQEIVKEVCEQPPSERGQGITGAVRDAKAEAWLIEHRGEKAHKDAFLQYGKLKGYTGDEPDLIAARQFLIQYVNKVAPDVLAPKKKANGNEEQKKSAAQPAKK